MGTLLDCFCDKNEIKQKEFSLNPPLNNNLISNENSNSYIIDNIFLYFLFS